MILHYLVETPYSRQQNTVLEFGHVVLGPLKHRRILWELIDFLIRLLWLQQPLRKLIQLEGSLPLSTTLLLALW